MAEAAEDRGDDLAPDATLATEIIDEDARRAQQLEYYGGDPDDVDAEDLASVDRGDSLEVELEEEEDDESEDESDEAGDEEDDSSEAEDDAADSEEEDEAGDGDEEDASDEGDDDAVQSSDSKPADQRIPLSRFNEVNERMKRAEARLAELEKQGQAVEEVSKGTYDFDAAEEEYTELLLSGDTKGAATKRAEIRSAEREVFLQEAQSSTKETFAEEAMMSDLDSLTSQASELYPIFDQNSPDYDQNATAKVLTFMRGYLSDTTSPMSPPDAFVAALADGIAMYDLDTRYGYAETESEPEPKPQKTTTKKAPKKNAKEKAELASKQPKSPAGHGRAATDAGVVAPDIGKMSDAEIEALPPETLARLRGDFVD